MSLENEYNAKKIVEDLKVITKEIRNKEKRLLDLKNKFDNSVVAHDYNFDNAFVKMITNKLTTKTIKLSELHKQVFKNENLKFLLTKPEAGSNEEILNKKDKFAKNFLFSLNKVSGEKWEEIEIGRNEVSGSIFGEPYVSHNYRFLFKVKDNLKMANSKELNVDKAKKQVNDCLIFFDTTYETFTMEETSLGDLYTAIYCPERILKNFEEYINSGNFFKFNKDYNKDVAKVKFNIKNLNYENLFWNEMENKIYNSLEEMNKINNKKILSK